MFKLLEKNSYQTLNLIQINKNALLRNFHFFQRLSNKVMVKIGETVCPIIELVCMNITLVDVSTVKKPYIGQKVVVFDNQPSAPNSIKNTADLIGTIPHEVFVNLAATTRRVLV